jgi:glutaminyl-peptide cyclotransferase
VRIVSLGRARAWAWLPGLAALLLAAGARAGIPVFGYEIVHTYPHDKAAFTEGLFYLDGFLYESTGLERQSTIRKVRLETGAVLQQIELPPQYFGEGIVNWGTHLLSLTWKSEVGFVWDLRSLKLQKQFSYRGEGWALTQDGHRIIMSDGTPGLRFLDPRTLAEIGHVDVTLNGKPVSRINELEWVDGEVYANVWETNWILRIDPGSGRVVGLINLAGLLPASDQGAGIDSVLNGIAYDQKAARLFVTGKNWPQLFEIRLVRTGELPQ